MFMQELETKSQKSHEVDDDSGVIDETPRWLFPASNGFTKWIIKYVTITGTQ